MYLVNRCVTAALSLVAKGGAHEVEDSAFQITYSVDGWLVPASEQRKPCLRSGFSETNKASDAIEENRPTRNHNDFDWWAARRTPIKPG